MSQNIFPSQVKRTPSFTDPRLIIQQIQKSGFDKIFDGGLDVKLSQTDLNVYLNRLSLTTSAQASQNEYGFLPSGDIVAELYSMPVYSLKVQSIVDIETSAMAATYNVGLMIARRLVGKQAIIQAMRIAALFGINASNGEGIINSPNVITQNLPVDSVGNYFNNYIPNELFQYLLNTITTLQIQNFSSGLIPKIVCLGPQRIVTTLLSSSIIQVTSFQREGAGSASTGVSIKLQGSQSGQAGFEIEYWFDDTLANSGPTYDTLPSDILIITIPSLENTDSGEYNTNEFGSEFPNQMNENNKMYIDAPAPTEVLSPLPLGATQLYQRSYITPGVAIRSEATIITHIQYESN